VSALKSLLKNYLHMLHNLIQKSIVMEMSTNTSEMLGLPAKKKFVLCSIVALLAYVVAQTCSSASFTPPVFLLGNFG